MTITLFSAMLLSASPAAAQTPTPVREVCVTIDDARDTLSAAERTAARLLLEKQFEIEGWHVVPQGCDASYTLSHVQLGSRITVTLTGPTRQLQGVALGLDDLPALYSQLVRATVTGRPMRGMNVIDRTNVTAAQAQPPHRVASDSFEYARIGFGTGGPGFGAGHRAEGDTIALDVSFMNFQGGGSDYSTHYGGGGVGSFSWIKLQGLRFTKPIANASPYYGGGFSWGSVYSWDNATTWSGNGLQGELTAGYEVGRASTMRVFVEANATLPLYNLTSYRGGSRYAAAFIASVGVGWQHSHR
jgi:hypothetical protein